MYYNYLWPLYEYSKDEGEEENRAKLSRRPCLLYGESGVVCLTPPCAGETLRLSPLAVLVLIRSNSVFAGGSYTCLSSLGRVRGARSCDKGRKVCEANARAQPVTYIMA